MPTGTTRLIADRYRLLDSLGRGGMGVVWEAEDSILQRRVAVKEVETPGGLSTEERHALEARVMREARAAARLNHPHVVTVFDVIEDDGHTFIVMELVEAPTLADVVANEGPLDPQRAAQIALDVLSALEAAHAEGIIHRDVKPGNVMIPPVGSVKLGDFGIASVKGDPKITSTGLILGSPSYMAPEQATHGTSGPESDLWALGALLYFALEGAPPFDKGQALPTLAAVVGEPARPMEQSGAFEELIQRLLSKEPLDRPSPKDIRDALGAASRGEISRQPSVAHPKRAPAAWIAVGVIVSLAAAVFWLLPNLGNGDEKPRREQRGNGNAAGGRDPAPGSDPAGDDTQLDTSNWNSYTDETTSYTVGYPEGWSPTPVDSTRTDFVDPESSTYLRVDWTDQPGDDPVASWESLEEDFAASHDGYERITIEPLTFKDMDAAWWEFTYSDGGAELHAVDLGFVTGDGSYGFALNFQTAAEDWDSSQDVFQAIQDSFEVPRG